MKNHSSYKLFKEPFHANGFFCFTMVHPTGNNQRTITKLSFYKCFQKNLFLLNTHVANRTT